MLDKIIRYEQGDMNDIEMIEMYQELLNTGLIFKLQGHYGRTANNLLLAGLITMPKGESK